MGSRGGSSSSGSAPATASARKRRLWLRCLAGSLLILAPLVYFAPVIACRPPVRSILIDFLLAGRAKQFQLDDLRVGWTTPLEMRGIQYRTDRVELLIESAASDCTLLDLLCSPADWGRVELQRPMLTLRKSASGDGNRVSSAIHRSGARTGSSRTMRWPRTIDLQVTGGAVVVQDEDGALEARELDAELRALPGRDQATFRVLARTGDPLATAHIAAQGSLEWPVVSAVGAVAEARIELVGCEATWISELLGRAMRHPAGAAAPVPSNQLRITGTTSGQIQLRRTTTDRIETRANLDMVRVRLEQPARGIRIEEPELTVSLAGRLSASTFWLDSLRLKAESLDLEAAGKIEDWSRDAHADLSGYARWDWDLIGSRTRWIGPQGIEISGSERRPWHFAGPLRPTPAGSPRASVAASVATRLDSIDLCGLKLGPLELAAHWEQGTLRFQPIQSPVQSGRLSAQPSITLSDGIARVRHDGGRILENIAIDENLCEWILRYVDPLLAVSGNLRGQLALDLDRLEIPLREDGMRRGSFQGKLVIDDAEFTPSESLHEIFAFAGIRTPQSIRTSQVIDLRLEEGRIHHHGLTLPVGEEQVMLDGWVDLDHHLSIRVSLPLTEQLLGKDKRLYRLLRGQRIEVPVTGTLEHLEINEDLLAHNIQRIIQTSLRDGFSGGDPLRGLLRRALK